VNDPLVGMPPFTQATKEEDDHGGADQVAGNNAPDPVRAQTLMARER